MNVELGPTLTAALERARAAAKRIRWSGFWLQLAGLTILTLFTMVTVGRSAYARAAAFDAESARMHEVETGIDRWAGMIEWPTAEETESWRESGQLFERLASTSVEPLALANVLARRGEEISGADVRIRLTRPDSAYIPPQARVGSWVLDSGRAALVVDLEGSVASMIGFLGTLPPQVEVAGLEISETGPRRHMSLLLLSREIMEDTP